MKHKNVITLIIISAFMLLNSCRKDSLEENIDLANEQGIDLLVSRAYEGITDKSGWGAGPFNWIYGSIYGGDANKGASPNDEPSINDFEMYKVLPSNSILSDKYNWVYEGVKRANTTLKTIAITKDASAEFLKNKSGEVYFLRAYFCFEGAKVFGPTIPWIDETMKKPDPKVDIYPKIFADLDKAIEMLNDIQESPGRANSWAAKALKAKALMHQGDLASAKPILKDVLLNGQTANGKAYGLEDDINDNWSSLPKNGKESIFAAQYSYEKGKANYEMALTHIYGNHGPGGCCGFFQPSNELANSYKVDKNGLPFLDNSYRNVPYVSVPNPTGKPYISINNNIRVDPRLDITIGRFEIPYKDWGLPDVSWVKDAANGGFYFPKKHIFTLAEKEANLGGGLKPDIGAASAINIQILSVRDIMLLYAECLANDGDLNGAMNIINQIRARAAQPQNMTMLKGDDPAANYQIRNYPSSHAAFSNKEMCIKAVRMERKLELAMEGQRWFDLARWGGDYMSTAIDEYLIFESNFIDKFSSAAPPQFNSTMFPIPQ